MAFAHVPLRRFHRAIGRGAVGPRPGAVPAFYRSLGFHLISEKERFATVGWEDHRLFLDQREGLPEPPALPVMNVRVMVPDVDRVWRLAGERGARVVAPIEDRPYGLRDFTIADPDGFGVRFATRLPPVAATTG